MSKLRLFDRIGFNSRNSSRYRYDINSIVDHLRRLLNSRQGTTQINPYYGMPDFSDLRAEIPDSAEEIESMITDVINRFEPRLSQVSVRYMYQDEHKSLHFQIYGVIESNSKTSSIYLESSVDTFGKMAIHENC